MSGCDAGGSTGSPAGDEFAGEGDGDAFGPSEVTIVRGYRGMRGREIYMRDNMGHAMQYTARGFWEGVEGVKGEKGRE